MQLGEKFGLEGEKLLAFVQEQQKLEDERRKEAEEREGRKKREQEDREERCRQLEDEREKRRRSEGGKA